MGFIRYGFFTIFILILLSPHQIFGESAQQLLTPGTCSKQIVIVGSNIENFFDPTDTWYKRDVMRLDWTQEKLDARAKNTARLLTQDGSVFPDLIALSELESPNPTALISIVFAIQSLYNIHYRAAYFGGGRDERGISVAALVKTDGAFGSAKEEITHYPQGPYNQGNGTRSIMELVFELPLAAEGGGRLLIERAHLFAVHFPSLRNPTAARVEASTTLRKRIERILSRNPEAKIMIIGDFNTIPSDRDPDGIHPIDDILLKPEAGSPLLQNPLFDLYELLSESQRQQMPPGTYFYRGDESFSRLDRVLVSRSFISSDIGIRIDPQSLVHYAPDFATVEYETSDGRIVRIPNAWNQRNQNDDVIAGIVNESGIQDHFPIIVSGSRQLEFSSRNSTE